MRGIVTGATGFLGFELVKLLLSKNWQVLALGRNLDRLKELEGFGAKTQVIDLETFTDISSSFNSAEIIFHCAALSSMWGRKSDFERVNVEGTKQVVRWGINHSVKRIVYISSTSVYFDFTDRFNIKESDAVTGRFANAYAKSKYQAENIVKTLTEGKMEYSILRPRGIIGKGDISILPRVLRVMRKGWFPLLRNGGAQVDLTHVKNVANAAYLAAVRKAARGEIFNVSNGQPITVLSLLESLADKTEKKVQFIGINYLFLFSLSKLVELIAYGLHFPEPMLTSYGVGLLHYSQTLDISKAKSILGYRPEFSIKDAIEGSIGDI